MLIQTEEVEMTEEFEMLEAIICILESGTGLGVDFCTLLSIYQLEDGRFSVSKEDPPTEQIFFRAEEAECFLRIRKEKKLGDGQSASPTWRRYWVQLPGCPFKRRIRTTII